MPPLNTFQRGCIAVAVSQALVLPSQAATIDITSLEDTSGSASICTLRDAIVSANKDTAVGGCSVGSDSDTIRIGSGFDFQTLTLTSELPTVTSNVTIDGAGSSITISGDKQHRIISVDSGELSLVNKLKLVNGYTSGSGGAISVKTGALALNSVSLIGNNANDDGGGIFSGPGCAVIISDSALSNNSASKYGGGIFSLGEIAIVNSALTNNSAKLGGGGASSVSGTVAISSSTLFGNRANDGGGVLSAFGKVVISNSTLSNNIASNHGGGIISGAATTISSSTLFENRALSGGGIRFLGETEGAMLTLKNNIVSGSSGSDEGGSTNGLEVSVSGTKAIRSDGNVLGSSQLSNAKAFAGFSPSATDILLTSDELNIQLDQIVEPLANNGGSTFTHELPADSPAVDNGINANCEVNDQRGEPRLLDDESCDIGAFESEFDGQF